MKRLKGIIDILIFLLFRLEIIEKQLNLIIKYWLLVEKQSKCDFSTDQDFTDSLLNQLCQIYGENVILTNYYRCL